LQILTKYEYFDMLKILWVLKEEKTTIYLDESTHLYWNKYIIRNQN